MIFSKLKSLIKLYNDKKKWRKRNMHNFTTLNKNTDLNKIKVGKMSYGPLNVYTWGSENEGLIIGSYVSIANDVKFILGGNHRYDTISTYPFKVMVCGEAIEAYSNGKIIVEDDVWIGMNSIIMSGVRIGRGSVIAAGSVVIKNVPEYAIVGGNPAKIIKYRFDKKVLEQVNNIDFNNLDEDYIKKNINLFYKEIDSETINKINYRGDL